MTWMPSLARSADRPFESRRVRATVDSATERHQWSTSGSAPTAHAGRTTGTGASAIRSRGHITDSGQGVDVRADTTFTQLATRTSRADSATIGTLGAGKSF